MKNLSISRKLAVGFAVVIAFAIAVGCIGVANMNMLETQYSDLYNNQMEPMTRISKALDCLQQIRIQTRDLVINVGNAEKQKEVKAQLDNSLVQMEQHIAAYDEHVICEDSRKIYNDAKNQYTSKFKPGVISIGEAALAGATQDELMGMMGTILGSITAIVDDFNKCIELQVEDAGTSVVETDTTVKVRYVIIVSVLVVAGLTATLLGIYVSGLISKPINMLTSYMIHAAKTGEIILNQQDTVVAQGYAKRRDETGQCIASTFSFITHVVHISQALEKVAGGDLTVEAPCLSDKDVMGVSLQKMVGNLNSMFGEINNATTQVTAGSRQISNGSQALAQGSAEQAAAVEELSTSMSEIASKTRKNAGMATHAAELAATIKQNAEKGSMQMDQMLEAVKEIQEASKSIGKVIKVIDDIAFQTNILALNAAVEAARAGQHGKGFAVVAEEVRNLAAKSADAAKDTEALIANSMEKSELGAYIAGETAVSLAEIVVGIKESGIIIGDMARSSEEQSAAIGQINSGIDQVAQVVNQNSATAQESASASEEMSEQADTLEGLVARFKLPDAYKI